MTCVIAMNINVTRVGLRRFGLVWCMSPPPGLPEEEEEEEEEDAQAGCGWLRHLCHLKKQHISHFEGWNRNWRLFMLLESSHTIESDSVTVTRRRNNRYFDLLGNQSRNYVAAVLTVTWANKPKWKRIFDSRVESHLQLKWWTCLPNESASSQLLVLLLNNKINRDILRCKIIQVHFGKLIYILAMKS